MGLPGLDLAAAYGQQHQYRVVPEPPLGEQERLQGKVVAPLRVVDDEDDGLPCGQLAQQPDQLPTDGERCRTGGVSGQQWVRPPLCRVDTVQQLAQYRGREVRLVRVGDGGEPGEVVQLLQETPDQACLADPGLPFDQYQPRLPGRDRGRHIVHFG